MTKRLLVGTASALTAALVAGGVTVAAAQYGGHDHSGGSPTHHAHGKKPKPSTDLEQMVASRLSWSAYLTGQAEVDADGDDAGDPAAKGTAVFMQVNRRTVCYGFLLRGAATPTLVHIHKGVAGKNGPPVVAFSNPPKDAEGRPSGDPGASSGCKTSDDPAEIAALRRIRKNPGKYYVNFHTEEFPDGAVRGQLSRVWYDKMP